MMRLPINLQPGSSASCSTAMRHEQANQIQLTEGITPLTLGAIAFLNTLPIYWPWRVPGAGASVQSYPLELIEAVPTELNASMLAGQLCVSPVSSAFYLRHCEQFILLDDLSVSSFGAVESVLFVADKAWGPELLEYETIAVPSDSETSIALLAHLLREATGEDCQSRFKVFAAHEAKQALANYGNALIIGDNALLAKTAGFDQPYQINDLSSLWQKETGRPFVFAVWVAQKEWAERYPKDLQNLNGLLCKNRDEFFRNAALFCDTLTIGSRQSQLPEEVLYRYYTHCLNYNLGPQHRDSLAQFNTVLKSKTSLSIVPSRSISALAKR